MAVHIGPNGVRISKVTPHGEEVVPADLEARILGALLWSKVVGAAAPLTGHSAVWPQLEALPRELSQARADLTALAVRVEKAVHGLELATAAYRAARPSATPAPGQ